jgi:type I restriction enzyme S subunit
MKAFIVNTEITTTQHLMFVLVLMQSLLLKHVRGVTADNIEFSLIKELPIPVPPLDLQNEFAQIVAKTEQQRELMEKSLTEMENNFNSLMQRAFKGDLF